MRIETHACSNCETIVAANVLEARRVMKCPRIDCENVLRFAELPEDVQTHYVQNRDRYRMD